MDILRQHDKERRECERILRRDSNNSNALQHLIGLADLEDTPVEYAQHLRKLWYQRICAGIPKWNYWNYGYKKNSRIRIGYVSGDLYAHSAAFGIYPVFAHADKSKFEIYVYDQTPPQMVDEMSIRMRLHSDKWHEGCRAIDDDKLAHMIHFDGIDILVDLTGHSERNRLTVFARQPAPIQVSAIGYPTGTGMPEMDYLICDDVLIPPTEEHLYAESVRYVPVYSCYEQHDNIPPVREKLPLFDEGVFTFGVINRAVKFTDRLLLAWRDILRRVPKSRLLLKDVIYDYPEKAKRVRRALQSAGIDLSRVTMMGKTNHVTHMQAYNYIDLSLDSYPQCGGISAMESVLMGVPLVTHSGAPFASRIGETIMRQMCSSADVVNYVAHDWRGYVDRAVALATSKIENLAQFRAHARRDFNLSYLGDTAAWVREYEKVIAMMTKQ